MIICNYIVKLATGIITPDISYEIYTLYMSISVLRIRIRKKQNIDENDQKIIPKFSLLLLYFTFDYN